jgi:hypothetical protein
LWGRSRGRGRRGNARSDRLREGASKTSSESRDRCAERAHADAVVQAVRDFEGAGLTTPFDACS